MDSGVKFKLATRPGNNWSAEIRARVMQFARGILSLDRSFSSKIVRSWSATRISSRNSSSRGTSSYATGPRFRPAVILKSFTEKSVRAFETSVEQGQEACFYHLGDLFSELSRNQIE